VLQQNKFTEHNFLAIFDDNIVSKAILARFPVNLAGVGWGLERKKCTGSVVCRRNTNPQRNIFMFIEVPS